MSMAPAGIGARDRLVAEGQDRSMASSIPAVAAFLWSCLCPRHREHGGLPAVCADPSGFSAETFPTRFRSGEPTVA